MKDSLRHLRREKKMEVMTEKYYTPSIEEFHVGFEYEEIVSGLKYDKKIYEGRTLNDYEGEMQGSIQEDIEDGEIRVKYLDKEDVLSLGWEPFANKEDYVFDYFINQYDSYQIHTQFDNQFTQIYNWGGTVFEGVVKNKSELKKLMQMLDIKKEDNEG